MSYTSHSSSQIGDSRGDSARHGSRSEEINQSSLFNVGVSDGGVGIILSRSWTRPSPSHHSVDHGRSSGFYSYDDNRIGSWSHTSQFSTYNHGGLNICHPRFPREDVPMGVHGENLHQNNPYYYYPTMPTYPNPSIPPHPHHHMPHHLYPRISPH